MKNKFMSAVLIIAAITFSQQFTEVTPGIPADFPKNSAWGDLDSDGDLDLVKAGINRIYRNDGASIFTDTGFETWFNSNSADLGDYDNDGDLDILFSGLDATKILRNDGNWTFTQLAANFPPIETECNAVWGDYDNDGDLDIALTALPGAFIYKNEGNGVFTRINPELFAYPDSYVYWIDYNCDGLLDILVCGSESILYKNGGNGVFTNINATLPGFGAGPGSVDWGDYDNDGDPDLLFTGAGFTTSVILRNERNDIFTDIAAGLQGVSFSSGEWGDYDNDGDLDVILTGKESSGAFVSKLYRNEGSGLFTDTNTVLTGIFQGSAVWGDYDNDGDLDIFMTGKYYTDQWYNVVKLYRNNCGTPNSFPSKPSVLLTEVINDSLKISFNPATDAQTPQSAITYNIDIDLNGEKYMSGMSDLSSGYRKIVKEGNLNYRTDYAIPGFSNLPQEEKSFSWKVQAVDNCFAGSEFANGGSFVFPSPRDLSISNKDMMTESDVLKWEYVSPEILDHYVIQIDEDRYFRSPIEVSYEMSKEYDAKPIYISMALKDFTGYETMVSDSIYFWRIKPVYNDSEKITIFSEEPKSFLYIFTDLTPGVPQHITISKNETDVVLTWDAVEVKQKGVTYNVYSSNEPYAEFPAGYTLEQSGITTTSWSEPVSEYRKFYVVTAYYSLQ